MYTNANVRPANDVECSARSTGATRALAEGNGASEAAYCRPHAPRAGAPNNAALTGLHSDISSASGLRSATRRSRISDCAPASPRLLGRIRARNRRPIGGSPTDQVSEIRRPVWSRRRTAHPTHPLRASSVNLYSWCHVASHYIPKPTQLRSKRRVDSSQTNSIPDPIRRAIHHAAFTTLRLAPTMTYASKHLTGSASAAALIK